jgi:hypothetical protein
MIQGLRYYSTWNFGWWLAAETGMMKLNGPLRTSIIATSLLGGYMTYVYPRKIVYYEKGEKKVVSRKMAILLDIVGHQLPMLRVLYYLRGPSDAKRICGIYIVLPASLYALINYLRGRTLADIYGISSHKLYFSSFFIMSCIGSLSHWKDAPHMYKKIACK